VTFRDCILIDAFQFGNSSMTAAMTDRQLGKAIRRIYAAYSKGDFDFIRSFPFVVKVYPESSPFCRRHIPLGIRREVLSSGPCARCGTTDGLTVDHIHPVSKGGTDDRANLQPMCLPCNMSKSNRI